MLKRTKKLIAILSMTLMLSSCSLNNDFVSKDIPITRIDYSKYKDQEIKDIALIINGILNLQEMLIQEYSNDAKDNENMMFSSSNLYLALSTIREGADSKTREELNRLLSLNDNIDVSKNFPILLSKLNNLNSNGFGLQQSNLFLANNNIQNSKIKKITLRDDFKESIAKNFDTSISHLDFNDKSNINATNKFIEKASDGFIQSDDSKILEPSNIFTLINVLYLNGEWQYKFNTEVKDNFTLVNGTKKQVNYLQDTNYIDYKENSNYKYIRLPLKEVGYAYFVLPNEDQKLNTLHKEIKNIVNNETFNENKVLYKLPELEFQTNKTKISEILSNIGFKNVLNNYNKISKENFKNTITISQYCKFKMDKNGIKAASVNQIKGKASASNDERNIKEFICNRPYMIVLTSKTNNIPLFVGEIKNP